MTHTPGPWHFTMRRDSMLRHEGAFAELLTAMKALCERAEAVADGIPVHKRHKGVSQAAHVAHMAGHLKQHVKTAKATLRRLSK